MNAIVSGNTVYKGVSEITIMHVESDAYEPEKEANTVFTVLKEALPPATFAELVALAKMCDPIPF